MNVKLVNEVNSLIHSYELEANKWRELFWVAHDDGKEVEARTYWNNCTFYNGKASGARELLQTINEVADYEEL